MLRSMLFIFIVISCVFNVESGELKKKVKTLRCANVKMPALNCNPSRQQIMQSRNPCDRDLQIMLQMRDQRPGGYGASQGISERNSYEKTY